MKGAFFGEPSQITRVFQVQHQADVAHRLDLLPGVQTVTSLLDSPDVFADVRVLISTWGMPELTPHQLDLLPNLQLVLYGAGDIRSFARPLLDRGITVVSAWRANAVPVAEFCLAHTLLAGKSYLRNIDDYQSQRVFHMGRPGAGNFDQTIGLIGLGAVGQELLRLLKPFRWNPIAFDKFMPSEAVAALGTEKVELEDLFCRSLVVSNHLIDNDETAGILSGDLFELMPIGATFLNTGRGRTVDSPQFVEVFRRRQDLTAILDVTDPEPLPADHPIWELPNVYVTTHIAGSSASELSRMADLCLEELDRWLAGEPLQHSRGYEALD